MRVLPLALALPLVVAASTARADAVWTEPCPFGARESTSHAGPRCEPWACTSDADCEGGLVCRPLRMCLQTFLIPVGGHGAFLDPPPAPTAHELVVGSCEPSEACAGTEEPRPPTAGSPQGEIRCAVASYCARPVLPSLGTVAPPTPAPPAPAPAPATTAPPSAPPANAAPPAPASRWGCAAGSARAPGFATLASLALVALLARRRPRSRTGLRGSAVLWLVSLVSGTNVAQAQRAALPAPWIETRITPAPLFQGVALACGRERAYAREREGRVAAWDGQAWSILPPMPGGSHDGESLWVSDAGVLFADAGRELASWDGSRWTMVPIDPHFERPGYPHQMEIDVISGLGEDPWLVGHAAIGLVVDGTVRPFDAGGAWWELGDLLPFSRTDVLLAGRGGLTRFDGTRWAREALPAPGEYVQLHALARDDVWAAGPRSVLHWDGHAWREQSAGISFPEPQWRRGRTFASIGGPRGDVHFATSSDVYRLGEAGWTRVLDETMRSPFAYAYGPVCATARQLLVGETSHVLVRPL